MPTKSSPRVDANNASMEDNAGKMVHLRSLPPLPVLRQTVPRKGKTLSAEKLSHADSDGSRGPLPSKHRKVARDRKRNPMKPQTSAIVCPTCHAARCASNESKAGEGAWIRNAWSGLEPRAHPDARCPTRLLVRHILRTSKGSGNYPCGNSKLLNNGTPKHHFLHL